MEGLLGVELITESGYEAAMLGLSLSHEAIKDKMPRVAERLSARNDSHCKFQRMIMTWWDITAPRYFWQQLDTYRVGVATQSGSTMHNIMKDRFTPDKFTTNVCGAAINMLNNALDKEDFKFIKENLPEGYLQRRVWMASYQVLKHIIIDRTEHRLKEWKYFVEQIKTQVEHPELILPTLSPEKVIEALRIEIEPIIPVSVSLDNSILYLRVDTVTPSENKYLYERISEFENRNIPYIVEVTYL